MDILSYLTELIKTRKEVGIVGLGTIYKKKSPGRYDAETHSFLPPGHKLEFREELEENRALAEFISKKKNISFDSSSYYVEQFSEELQKLLRETGRADLGELGYFTADEDGIFFNPAAAAGFGFDFYGFPDLKDEIPAQETEDTSTGVESGVPSATEESSDSTEQQEAYSEHIAVENEQRNDLDQYSGEEITVSKEENGVTEEQLNLENNNADLSSGDEPDEQPVYEEISEFKHESIPSPVVTETPEGPEEAAAVSPDIADQNSGSEIPPVKVETDPYWNFDKAHHLGASQFYDSPDKTEKEERNFPAYLKVIIAIAVLLAIIATIYFVRPDLFQKTDTEKSVKLPPEPGDLPKIDSATHTDTTTKAKADTLKQPLTATAPVVNADTTTTWEVIGASVINQKEVDQVLAEFKKGGIHAKVIPGMPGKRRIKISIATFYDETSAREGRKELALKLKNPDLYIYQNKHKQNTQIK